MKWKTWPVSNVYSMLHRQGELLFSESVEIKAVLPERRSRLPSLSSRSKNTKAQLFLFKRCLVVCQDLSMCFYLTLCKYLFIHLFSPGVGRKHFRLEKKFNINNLQVRDVAKGGSLTEFELHDTSEEADSLVVEENVTIAVRSADMRNMWVAKINAEVREAIEMIKALEVPRPSSLGAL
mgnify:CR=1 FL=1